MANRHRSQIREVINRNTVVNLALEYGFNAFLPVYDGGVDFVPRTRWARPQGSAQESLDNRTQICRTRHLDCLSDWQRLVPDAARRDAGARGDRWSHADCIVDRRRKLFTTEAVSRPRYAMRALSLRAYFSGCR
jgi:hypothetical protein